MNIRNIIFDLGGVLIGIDYQATITEFKKLGIIRFDEFFTQMKQHHLFDRWDVGGISSEEFRDQIREISGLDLDDLQIDFAWNAMLGKMPPNRFPLLRKVAQHYRIFLLSNTNAIHIPYFKKQVMKEFGYDGLDDFFVKLYYSHEIGHRKPDAGAFIHVIDDNGLSPRETLFFDDTYMHVEGARKTGLNAYWIDLNKEDVTQYFDESGKLTGNFFTLLRDQSSRSHG